MEENKNIILTMQYEDGTTGKRELLSIFKAENGRDYAALLPLNEDETAQDGASIELVRVTPYQNEDMEEDYMIEGITTEAELQTAKEAFEQLSVVATDEADEASIDDLPTLSFKNGNGQFEDWKIVDVFDHNNRKYIALIPVSDNADGEKIHIHLMRLELTVQGGIEGCEVSTIPSDMEYDEVAGVFEKRVSEANET